MTHLDTHPLAGLIEIGEEDLAGVGGGEYVFCKSYVIGPFLLSCYCNTEDPTDYYCDVVWEGGSGS